jgi:protein involved in polysaccharide export with SLBB domain
MIDRKMLLQKTVLASFCYPFSSAAEGTPMVAYRQTQRPTRRSFSDNALAQRLSLNTVALLLGCTLLAAPPFVHAQAPTAVPAAPSAVGGFNAPAVAPAGAPVAAPIIPLPSAPRIAPAQTTNAGAETSRVLPSESGAKSEGPERSSADAIKAEPIRDRSADQSEFQRFVAQATGRALPLFGYELFANPSQYAPVVAAPVPTTYILGPGDELVLQTYGVVALAQTLVIDRNGRVNVPSVGPVQMAGLPFGDAEKVLATHIGKVYSNFTLSLTMGRLRSIEIFVLGQAAKPGKHVVSGLSTLINAMFETGGANSNGSLRNVQLRRGGKTIASVDLYKFLAQGDSGSDARLQSGDVIFIAPAGQRAAVLGTVNAPAIYELKEGESIQDVLGLSGGLPTLAAPQKAVLERVDARRELARSVEDFALDEAGLKRKLKAGDILTIFQISPQIADAVTLQGNVAAPMRYTFKPGMRVSDLLSDQRLLIPTSYWAQVNSGAASARPNRPEVNLDYATIQRLDPVKLTTRIIAFSPIKALSKDRSEDLLLQSSDIITIYGPNEPGLETEDSISLTGELVGGTRRFPWREGMTVKDLIPSTQWLVDYYNYWQRSSAQSIRNDINWDYAQIIRRIPDTLQTESLPFNLGQQVMGSASAASFKPLGLQPGDRIALFTTAQIPVPTAKRAQFVTLRGEVAVPGNYQIKPRESLRQLIARAGGFTNEAYVYATIFTRESTRVQQQINLDAAVRRLESQINSQVATRLQNQSETASQGTADAQIASQRVLLARVQSLKASGRISLDMAEHPNTLPDLPLEDGDSIVIPNRPSFVGVFGAVAAETSFIAKDGLTVSDYVARAGPTREADVGSVMLIRGDGSVVAASPSRAWLSFGGISNLVVYPGDSIFVPEEFDRRTFYTQFVQGAKDWTAILYQFGIGAAALKTIRNN